MSFNDRGEVEAFLNFANAGMGYFSALEMEKKAGNPFEGGEVIFREAGEFLSKLCGKKVPPRVSESDILRRAQAEVKFNAAQLDDFLSDRSSLKSGGNTVKSSPTPNANTVKATPSTPNASAAKADPRSPGFIRGVLNFPLRMLWQAGPGLLPNTLHFGVNQVRGLTHALSRNPENPFRRGMDAVRRVVKSADEWVPEHAFNTGSKFFNGVADSIGGGAGLILGPSAASYILGDDSPVTKYYNVSQDAFNYSPIPLLIRQIYNLRQGDGGMNKEGGWGDVVEWLKEKKQRAIEWLDGVREGKLKTEADRKAVEAQQNQNRTAAQNPPQQTAQQQELSFLDKGRDKLLSMGIKAIAPYFDDNGNFKEDAWKEFAKNNPESAAALWPIVTRFVSMGAVGTSAATINSLYKQGWMPNYLMKQYIAPFIVQKTVDGIVEKYKAYYPEYYAADPNREKELRTKLTQQIQKQGEDGIDLTNADKLDNGTLALGLGLAGLVGGGAMMLFGGGDRGGNGGGGGNEMVANGRSGGGGPEWIRKAQEGARSLMQTQQRNAAMAANSYVPTGGTTYVGPGGRESTFLGTWQNNVNTGLAQNSLDASYRTLANPGQNITNEYLDRSAARAVGGGGNTATA